MEWLVIVILLVLSIDNVQPHGASNLGLSGSTTSYRGFKLLRMDTAGLRDQKFLYDFLLPRADFWTEPHVNGSVDLMISPRDFRAVEQYFYRNRVPYKVLMNDVQSEVDAQMMQDVYSNDLKDTLLERSTTVRRQGGNMLSQMFQFLFGAAPRRNNFYENYRRPRKVDRTKFRSNVPIMSWDKYHRLGDIYDYMNYLQEQYPQTAEIIDIGRSVQKRPMLLLKIGSQKFTDKPAIVIEAGIHAREWISPATATFIMRELVENQAENQDLIDFFDFYILPVANPDGYEYSFTANRLWRKNRARNGGLTSLLMSLCDGVDLNRNFGYQWKKAKTLSPQAGSSQICMETYAGPAPFSEPEARNIANFVSSIQQNVVSYLMLHNYGQKILYPWSYTDKRIPDWKDLQRMGEHMARSIEASSGLDYAVGSAPHTQYLASGGSDDWARGEMGVKWVFLLELPDKGYHGFLLPAYHIAPTGRSIFRGIRAMAVKVSHTLAY